MATSTIKKANLYQYHDVKSLITPTSGVTINSAYIYVYDGRVAQLNITATFSSAQTADTSYNIGSLAASLKPHNNTGLTSAYGSGQINSSGDISFRPQLNLGANSSRTFSAFYMLLAPYYG